MSQSKKHIAFKIGRFIEFSFPIRAGEYRLAIDDEDLPQR
jgi:hypothetical protein